MFSSEKPIGLNGIKAAFKGTTVKKDQIQDAIERLMTEYAGGKRGVSLETVGGGFQLRTKVDNARFLRNMGKTKSFRLSGPSLETLAIIAYKQPLTKSDIDHIRGVESGHLVRALMDRGLVAFAGKSDAPGKPMTYTTTKKFLEIFGLRNLRELPSLNEIDELIPEGIDEQSGEKMTLDQVSEKLGENAITTYSEGEEELQEIASELSEISSTTDFFEQEKVRQREKRDRERAEDIRQAITFGDEVNDADRKWLAKWEANQAAIAQGIAQPSGETQDAAAEPTLPVEETATEALAEVVLVETPVSEENVAGEATEITNEVVTAPAEIDSRDPAQKIADHIAQSSQALSLFDSPRDPELND